MYPRAHERRRPMISISELADWHMNVGKHAVITQTLGIYRITGNWE